MYSNLRLSMKPARARRHWFGSGSGSAFCSPGSGSVLGMRIRIRIQEQGNLPKLTNKTDFLPLKMAFVPKWVPMFYDILSAQSIFSMSKSNFLVAEKSDQDPDPHWLGSLNQNPDLDPHIKAAYADPKHWPGVRRR
jgi:hypothetical protein